MTSPRLPVAALQMPPGREDLAFNRQMLEAAITRAAKDGARLVALPELALTPYFCAAPAEKYRRWAESVQGESSGWCAELARRLGCAILLPLYEHHSQSGCYHNAVIGFDRQGKRLGNGALARKLHLPVNDYPPPGFDEAAHFTPGDELQTFEIEGWRCAVLICYDRRFPECWRALRRAGVELVIVPVAGSGGDDAAFFLGELRTHAKENGLIVLCANKVGEEWLDGMATDNYGESCVINADGAILAHRSRTQGPGVVNATLEHQQLVQIRKQLRYFDDRRGDLFGPVPHGWVR
ncbi:carbon-nitrogen hydrolase family protein [Sodalis ligni]|uniref:carbon-nitrogen hydrolase family protein n=1 Tax=Sodalis ligni TaxID=2697027 RepID=UPI00193FD4CE|nr:carbon-nitrogen hydrolase family protein [Sodalis ligni]QWA09217.1 carbon-nitrogen hydrolase family protein [Sodalis ligni]